MSYPPKPNFKTPTAAERNKMFGTFNYQNKGDGTIRILGGWESQNIVRVSIPQLIGVEAAPKTGIVTFHKKGAEQLQGFFQAVEDENLQHLILSWAGSFYPRFIRGSRTTLSNHSWGTAFDINAAWNGLGKQPAPVGAKGSLLKLVPIANDFGFFWGGHYNSRLDGMHFELAVLDKFRKTFHFASTAEIEKAVEVSKPIIEEPVVLEMPKLNAAGNVSHNSAAISEPMSVIPGADESNGNQATDGEVSTQTTIKTDTVEVAAKNQTPENPQSATNFQAIIPQIDTARTYLKRMFSGSILAAIGAFWLGLPMWIQISFVVLVLVLVIGGIVIFARYYKDIFAFATAMNTLRATKGVDNPILTTETND